MGIRDGFLNDFSIRKLQGRGKRMLKGKIIINFEYDEEKECSWDIQQEGESKLDDENIIYLLQHITSELVP